MASHNLAKWTRQILRRHAREDRAPSLTLHLYTSHFRFEQQNGVFLFESPMKCFLEYIREQRLPSDLIDILDRAKVPFFEGCLIVQVHDHRANPSTKIKQRGFSTTRTQLAANSKPKDSAEPNGSGQTAPEVYRIVLGPSTETLWTDLAQLAESDDSYGLHLETEDEVLQVEARFLAVTQPNLCLDPNFEVTRMANSVLRATTLACPESGKGDSVAGRRSKSKVSTEEEEQQLKTDQYMHLMDETYGRTFAPTFSRLTVIQGVTADKAKKEAAKPKEVKQAHTNTVHPSHAAAIQAISRVPHPLAQPPSAPSLQQSIANALPQKVAQKRTYSDAGSPADPSGPAKKKTGRPNKFQASGSPPPDSVAAAAKKRQPPARPPQPPREQRTRKASQNDIALAQTPTLGQNIPVPTMPGASGPVIQPPPLMPTDPNSTTPQSQSQAQHLSMYNPILNQQMMAVVAQQQQQQQARAAMQSPQIQSQQPLPPQLNHVALQAALQQQGISNGIPNMQSHPALMQFQHYPAQIQQQLMMQAMQQQAQQQQAQQQQQAASGLPQVAPQWQNFQMQ